ncbi:MAG: Fic family protein [Acidimicrobiia bacterium]|nr:Fic family protein [Acidimicrobiia bacterium]
MIVHRHERRQRPGGAGKRPGDGASPCGGSFTGSAQRGTPPNGSPGLAHRNDRTTIRGKIRTEQNWIGGTSWGPLNAEFVPPPPDMLPMLLEDLVEFCNRADLPAVVQAAVAHAQFETLHPFADGNGRAGRCLIHIILGRRGMEGPLRPPISLGLAADKRSYIEDWRHFALAA